ncbi:hypothetical protein KDW_20380 [Dictyobacter vulcani]|uniref:Recombinase domain-containing protein n=1 Tax=Dictyobacter vulcani TaxID=2607529 RepID=A0A5J4KRT4_9CHLR|nr:hypothetical protein KDW_20380 [Dictyobacter vulcani]
MVTKRKHNYTTDELYNPQPRLNYDACLYARQSTAEQVVNNPESHKAQTIYMLKYTQEVLGYKNDGSTGTAILFVENQISEDGEIKNSSGTWPIDRRPGLKAILDMIEEGRVKLVIAEFVDRLFRDEDRIDSNIFIKICKEHGCYVHISSKRMTYNFINPQHAEMFRMEVQMAAAYIENHVRGTMHGRRRQKRAEGYWAGFGSIPINYLVDKREGSPTYGKFVPYAPNAKISIEIYDRFIELGFEVTALCEELAKRPYIYPDFEDWVYKDFEIKTRLKPAPSGKGFLISRSGLIHMLCNINNIGALQVEKHGKEHIIWNNHEPIIDEARFWLVYDHLQNTRPDGTPTGRNKQVRYIQRRYEGDIKPLLKPISSHEDVSIYYVWKSYRGQTVAYYQLNECSKRLRDSNLLSAQAKPIEEAIVKRMFAHIRATNLLDLKERHKQQRQKLENQAKKLKRDLEAIEEELVTLEENMSRVKTPAVVERLENTMCKVLARKTETEEEYKAINNTIGLVGQKTLEEELEDLEESWEKKTYEFKRSFMQLVIDRVVIDQISPHFYTVKVEWAYKEWGTEERHWEHKTGGRIAWTEEEIETLKALYATETDRFVVMQAIPTRSWKTIKHIAHDLKLKRERISMHWENSKGMVKDGHLSWNDRLYLASKGLSTEDYASSKLFGWCSPSFLQSATLKFLHKNRRFAVVHP